jgi:hypothetical protein
VQQHQRDQQAQHRGPDGIAGDHRQPPVKAVRQRTAGQAEHKLHDQPNRADNAGYDGRVSERQDEQRVGDEGGVSSGVR